MNRYSVDEAAERLDHATFGIPESNLNLQKLLRSAEKILVLQDCIEKKCDQLENFTSSKRDYQNKRGGESDEFNYNTRKKTNNNLSYRKFLSAIKLFYSYQNNIKNWIDTNELSNSADVKATQSVQHIGEYLKSNETKIKNRLVNLIENI